MSVLQPDELEASPLADLHALASELGVEGYRRLRREELIAALLQSQAGAGPEGEEPVAEPRPREPEEIKEIEEAGEVAEAEKAEEAEQGEEESAPAEQEETRSGVLDILPNGSGFVRADAFAHSADDVYVSPAQIRRCELRTGDQVSGPVRRPRRSERYSSLVRVETVNGAAAEPPAERPAFDELTPAFAGARLAAPEELAPAAFGKGSRVAIAGPPGAGATTVLRRIARTLVDNHPDLDTVVVLAGARPEEVPEWRREVTVPVVGGSFDESADRQGEVASMAVERAKRAAERGDHAAILVDSLEFLPGHAARRLFGAARNTEEGGSITVIAATGIGPEPARHATTRVVLGPPSGEHPGPLVDGERSGTLRAELLG